MGEKEWYFFSLRDRKYPTGLRTNRATEAGYWKTTGKDKEIYRGGVVLIGMKKTLVFYRGRAPKGEKTNWVMHEYRLDNKHSFRPTKEEWVVCRVFQKTTTIKKPQPNSPSQDSNEDTNTNPNEYGDIDLSNINSLSSTSTLGFNNLPSLQNYHNNYNNNINNLNLNTNMNLNLNWAKDMANLPQLSWPSTLLSPNLNSTVNSLLLKALQFKNTYHQPPPIEVTTTQEYSYLGQGLPPLGGDIGSDYPSSSNGKEVEGMLGHDHIDQQDQQQFQEQPFNLDSIW
ncbi:uncharacterized protein LOC141602463 isoform X1 [Silene latifolia]